MAVRRQLLRDNWWQLRGKQQRRRIGAEAVKGKKMGGGSSGEMVVEKAEKRWQ